MAVLGSDVVRIRLRRAIAARGPISATRTKEMEADREAEPRPRPTAKILDLRREATMRRSPVAWCGLAFLVSFPTFGAETIVERIDLIDVRWAEASLASGPGLTIPAAASVPGKPSTGKGDEYPFLWRIEFFEGRRTNKTPGELGEKAVVEDTSRRVGGLYIVGDFADGRDGAKIYGRELEAAVRRIDQPSLEARFELPTSLVESGIRAVDGDARLLYCSEADGSPSWNGEATSWNGDVKKSANGLTSTLGRQLSRECRLIVARAAEAAEFARTRLGYEPLTIITETVTFDSRSQLDLPPIDKPDLMKVETTPAGPGQGWVQSIATENGETILREAVALTEDERAAGRESPSSIVEVRLRNGEMPVEVARRRGAIVHFDVERIEKRLGRGPRTAAIDRWSTTVALSLSDDKASLDIDRWVELATTQWARHAGPLSPQAVADAAVNAGREIGGLEMLSIFCPSPATAPPGAQYCVRFGCAKITNGPLFCQELAVQFQRR